MAISTVERPHGVVAALDQIAFALEGVRDLDPMFMRPVEQAEALCAAAAVRARLVELEARIIAAAELPGGLVEASGSKDTAGWLALGTMVGHDAGRAQTRFAQALERYPQVAAGLRAGRMSVEQAQAITRGLDRLPADVDAVTRDLAESHLVEQTELFDPRQLRILARRVLDVVAPEVAEAQEARAIADEERTAWEKTRASLRIGADGITRFTAVIPNLSGTRLANFLHAITNPRLHPDGDDVDPNDAQVWRDLPYPHQLGRAFCELLERIDPTMLPDHGGTNTELMVLIDLGHLKTEVGTATVLGPNGIEKISAAEARRLACNAGIIPAVLGAKGEVLDLGRSARLASRAQRKALMAMHATCAGEHCDTPVAWAEIHHLDPWATGGKTDLKDLIPLCKREHQMLHSGGYLHHVLPNGKVRFTRRC